MRLLVLILCMSIVTSLYAERTVAEQDSLALLAFYQATNGDQWIRNDNWQSTTVDEWYGVKVEDGRVSALILSANNLSGMLPDELGNLSEIKNLFISYNQITGQIPASVGELQKLEMLWAQYNSFSGQIPSTIGGMDSLKTFNISHNGFSGSLPEGLGKLKNLENLNLQFNSFESVLPDTLGALFKLKYLYLNNNGFIGAVPASFQKMISLCMASFSDNYLTDLPDLSGISSLSVSGGGQGLQVQNNRLDFKDIQPNMGMFATAAAYAPQRVFATGLDIMIHPGDTLAFDMPGQTIINTTDTNTIFTYKRNGVLVQESRSTIYNVQPATAEHLGTYSCYATDVDVPGLILNMESIQLLSDADSVWLSVGTYLDGNLVDTVDYMLELYKKEDEEFKVIELEPQISGGRCEMLIEEGEYYIKIVPEGDRYMVRYSSNNNQWNEKTISKASAGATLSFNSHLVRQASMTGTGVISGTISKAESGPIQHEFSVIEGERGNEFSGADVYLYDLSQGKYLKHSRSNASGAYEFNGLDNGSYQIIIDYPVYLMADDFKVNITSANSMIEQKSFSLVNRISTSVGTTSVKDRDEDLMVYPNPTQGVVFVKGKFIKDKLFTYTLYDLNGRSVASATINSYAQVAGIELDRNVINAGMYLLEINNGQSVVNKRIMIK